MCVLFPYAPLLPHLGGPAAFTANIHQPPTVQHSSRTEAEPGPSQTLNDSSVLYGDWCFQGLLAKQVLRLSRALASSNQGVSWRVAYRERRRGQRAGLGGDLLPLVW